ncbi:MAG: lysophospholipid acyltransferase family protein [bacterium]
MLHVVLKIVFLPVRLMPRRLELVFGELLGWVLYHVVRFKRNNVRRNLLMAYETELRDGRMALNEIKKIERENYSHYGRLVFEILHIPFDASRFAKKNVKVHNVEHLKNAISKKKGVFFLTAHTGYWEIMGVMGMKYDIPLNIITKYLRIKFFDDIWVKSRESYGIKLIDEVRSARSVLKALHNGEVVGMVLDQFMGPPIGERILFFGKPAWTISSLAWFVQKTGAAVVPVVNYRKKDGTFDLVLYPEIDFEKVGSDDMNVKHNTQRYSDVVEGFVRKCPEQWIWVHRRWKRVKEDDQNI